MKVGTGGSQERMTWGKVEGQAPQGRDAEAGQRKSRLSAVLDLTNERGPACFVCGQQEPWRARESTR